MQYYEQDREDRLGIRIRNKIKNVFRKTLVFFGNCFGNVMYFICDIVGIRLS